MGEHEEKILALIGARSGSKGVPHKNIRPLSGKPLMSWIIEAAKHARLVNRVIVSTDSAEYALIAKECGAEVPFLRPADISGDASTDLEYITHAVNWLREHEAYVPDIVLRLVPTTPFQRSEDIDACIEKLLAHPDAHASVVVAEARQHPHKAIKIVKDSEGRERVVSYITESGRDVTPLVRQQYDRAYFRANIVASRIETIRAMQSLTGDSIVHHEIPQERALDIDSAIDFLVAEELMRRIRSDGTFHLA